MRVTETRGSRSSRATTGDSHVVVPVLVGAGMLVAVVVAVAWLGTLHLAVCIDLLCSTGHDNLVMLCTPLPD